MITQELHLRVAIPNGHLSTIIVRPKEGKSLPAIIFANGSGGLKESFQTIQYFFAAKGFYSISFDFRGRGDSSGQPLENSLRDQQYDLKHIFSFITYRQPIIPQEISLFGTSMGAFAAASVSDELPLKNLILSAPAIYLPEHEQIPQKDLVNYSREYITNIKNREQLSQTNSLLHLSNFQGNVLVLEHQKDKTIPQWLCHLYRDASQKARRNDYQILHNIEHPVLTKESWRDILSQVMYDWFSSINQAQTLTPQPSSEDTP